MLSILSHIVGFRNGKAGFMSYISNIITGRRLFAAAAHACKTDCNKMTYRHYHDQHEASALHDIGKIAIRKGLNKPGRLTAENSAYAEGHSISASAEILMVAHWPEQTFAESSTCKSVGGIIWAIYDGSGYPDGLKDAIPLSARWSPCQMSMMRSPVNWLL